MPVPQSDRPNMCSRLHTRRWLWMRSRDLPQWEGRVCAGLGVSLLHRRSCRSPKAIRPNQWKNLVRIPLFFFLLLLFIGECDGHLEGWRLKRIYVTVTYLWYFFTTLTGKPSSHVLTFVSCTTAVLLWSLVLCGSATFLISLIYWCLLISIILGWLLDLLLWVFAQADTVEFFTGSFHLEIVFFICCMRVKVWQDPKWRLWQLVCIGVLSVDLKTITWLSEGDPFYLPKSTLAFELHLLAATHHSNANGELMHPSSEASYCNSLPFTAASF